MSSLKKIIPNTVKIGFYTLASRIFGIVREILMARYLGAGAVSDAFFTAFKFPNSLRKIFAEGALSAVFVPALTQKVAKEGPSSIRGLMSLSFLCIEGIVLLLCACVMIFSTSVAWFMAPGFSPEQQAITARFLFIMMPFIFFLSSSALCAGALQSVHHFFIPACAPILFNIWLIGSLAILLFFQLPVINFCYCILFAGALQFALHLYGYRQLKFGFGRITPSDWQSFGPLFLRFIPSLLSMSLTEINLLTSNIIASYLPTGSWTVIYYGNRFMGIPQGIFAVSLSTVLLPYFSHITTYAPRRMSYLIFESAKLVAWITTLTAFIMIFLSPKIFITFFLSQKFTLAHTQQAAVVLSIYLTGLFFFSFHKIVSNVYYSFKVMWFPATITGIAAIINIFCCLALTPLFGLYGIAASTLVSAIFQTLTLTFFLPYFISIRLYYHRFLRSYSCTIAQALCLMSLFLVAYYSIIAAITTLLPTARYFLCETIALWLWCGPLLAALMFVAYKTRHFFGISLSLLDYQ